MANRCRDRGGNMVAACPFPDSFVRNVTVIALRELLNSVSSIDRHNGPSNARCLAA